MIPTCNFLCRTPHTDTISFAAVTSPGSHHSKPSSDRVYFSNACVCPKFACFSFDFVIQRCLRPSHLAAATSTRLLRTRPQQTRHPRTPAIPHKVNSERFPVFGCFILSSAYLCAATSAGPLSPGSTGKPALASSPLSPKGPPPVHGTSSLPYTSLS